MDWIDLYLIPLIKALILFVGMLVSVPVLVVFERKIIGRIQVRPGPNRVGPWGILQGLVDGIKLMLKEDYIPPKADRTVFLLAPLASVVPAFLVMVIVPFGPSFELNIAGKVREITLSLTELPIGILYYFAVTSVGVFGVVMAGWSSNSKYSLLGGIRSSAQLISYEITLGLSLIGILLITGSFGISDIVASQSGGFWTWHVFRQPLAFMLFMIGGFAETSRLPFDLPEGESELGAGFHTEYSSIRFAMFMLAEYLHVINFCAIVTTLFLGGYHGPFAMALPTPIAVLAGLLWFGIKAFAVFFFFVWVRATLPRLRYDQLMNLGWKIMFPLGIANLLITSGVIAFGLSPAVTGFLLFGCGAGLILIVDRVATTLKRRTVGHAS